MSCVCPPSYTYSKMTFTKVDAGGASVYKHELCMRCEADKIQELVGDREKVVTNKGK